MKILNQKFYNPNKDILLIKDYTNENNRYFRNAINNKPVYKIIDDCIKNENYFYIILKDLKTEKFITSKKFSKYYNITKTFNDIKDSIAFIEDVKNNIMYYSFFEKTLNLLNNNNHPFILENTYKPCYNGITYETYNAMIQLQLLYANIINKNKDNYIFYSNNNLDQYENSLIEYPYTIEIEFKNKKEILFPSSYLKTEIPNNKDVKYKINQTTKIDNSYIETTIYEFFKCMAEKQTYKLPLDKKIIKDCIKKNQIKFLNKLKEF